MKCEPWERRTVQAGLSDVEAAERKGKANQEESREGRKERREGGTNARTFQILISLSSFLFPNLILSYSPSSS